MSLTTEQATLVAADIIASPDLDAVPKTLDGAYAIAAMYNETAAPDYIVWLPNVDPNHILENGMVWSDLKNLSSGQISIWTMMTAKGYINATKTNERDGLDEAFGKNSATVSGLQKHLKGPATRLQKLLATGPGTDLEPSTSSFVGTVNYRDIYAATGW